MEGYLEFFIFSLILMHMIHSMSKSVSPKVSLFLLTRTSSSILVGRECCMEWSMNCNGGFFTERVK